MTFSLTEKCLFCGKSRKEGEEESWKTLVSVFETREENGHTHRVRLGAGTVVTVCRECRKTHTVEEMITEARKVW